MSHTSATLEEPGPFKPYASRPFSSRAVGHTATADDASYETDPWYQTKMYITD